MRKKKDNKVNLESSIGKKPLRKLSSKKMRSGKKRLKDYGKVLLAKQLLRALYNNPREKVFKRYFVKDKSGACGINDVIGNLNRRLEIVLTAMGGAVSNSHARQLINHGKISVNGYIVKERGYLLSDGDIVASAVPFVQSRLLSFKKEDAKLDLMPQASFADKSVQTIDSKTESLVVASLKPKKIPKYLKLKTPILSAQLLVNSDLNYGIYYGKPIPQAMLEGAKLETKTILEGDQVGFGWKNTNIKAVKNILLAMKTAHVAGLEEDQLKLYTLLYNLVQAYYSRVK